MFSSLFIHLYSSITARVSETRIAVLVSVWLPAVNAANKWHFWWVGFPFGVGRWAQRGRKQKPLWCFTHGAGLSFIKLGGVGRSILQPKDVWVSMRSEQAGEARRIITPPPAPITPGLFTTGVTFDHKSLFDLKQKKSGHEMRFVSAEAKKRELKTTCWR